MGKMQAKPFSGEADAFGQTQDPVGWLEHYEDVCNMNGWTSHADMIRNASISLTGEAEVYYNLYKSVFRAPGNTWPQFVAAFTSRFRSANFIDELEVMVQNPVQKEGESVR